MGDRVGDAPAAGSTRPRSVRHGVAVQGSTHSVGDRPHPRGPREEGEFVRCELTGLPARPTGQFERDTFCCFGFS